MAVTPASFHGWPAQLRFARAKPLTNAHLRANALAHNLYLTLTNAAASASFEQIAGQKVGQMLSAYDLPVVIEAAILAARLFSAGRLNKAIEILSNKHLFEVAAEIEELATQLADQLLVGDELPTDLAITGAITNDTMMVILKEIPETLKYFKYSELADFDLINGLRNDPQKRERFIAERKNYQPASSMAELEAQLKAKFNQAKKLLGEASDLDLLFWNPYFLIIKQLPDEGSKAIVYEGFSALLDISKCLDHDICSTFSSIFAAGLFESGVDSFPHLRLRLHAFANLRQHLRHFRNVASVNKFRLDGQLPVSEKVALSQIVADAVCTASYRCRLPVRESASLTPGFINSYVYEDAAADIIPAMLELVVYNLIKNAFKAMLQARKTTIRGDSFNALEQATKETTEFGVSVCLRKDREYRNVMVIAVEDNAAGFDFNALISEAKHVIADPKSQEIIRQMSVFVRLKKWEDSPFVLRTLSLGEVLDLAFVPRISGFHVQQMSSGIGLAEAAEFSSYLGMKILVTNTYQGGALINLILGPEEDVNQVIMRELGHRS